MINNEYNFGVLKYSSTNIGDEIQSIAAMRFLPQINNYIHRERLDKFKPKNGKETKLIMNAWWMWQPKHFPPSSFIKPLLISMHIREAIRTKFLQNKVKDYLIEYGPVGCRDMDTYNWLSENNIPAYFSGCLTLTLQRNTHIPRENYILCVDVPIEIVNEIKRRTSRPVYDVTRMITPFSTAKERFMLAKMMLRLYHNAHCVVSPRLHVILPCLAMETPVLRLVGESDIIGTSSRYSGYETFVRSIFIDDFLTNKNCYNFSFPPRNPRNHIKIRNELIKKCKDFTGYDRNRSLILHHINPLYEMIKLSEYSPEKLKRVLYWASITDLEEILKMKKEKGKTRHDVKF